MWNYTIIIASVKTLQDLRNMWYVVINVLKTLQDLRNMRYVVINVLKTLQDLRNMWYVVINVLMIRKRFSASEMQNVIRLIKKTLITYLQVS